jgi:integrase
MSTPDRRRPFVEKRGDRWRVRWPDSEGNLRSSSRADDGQPFTDKEAAERYGWEQMGQIARGQWLDPRRSGITLADWVNDWWAINSIDALSGKSARKYRADIELHFLPAFGQHTLAELAEADVTLATWFTRHRADYAANTVENRRNLLSTILNDAVANGRMTRNPLVRSNRRGRRSKRDDDRAEKAWATPLQALLIAERAAVYAGGEPSAFVMMIAFAYTGMRSRELVGLERRYVNSGTLKVEWQLVEHTGGLTRERPKYDSRRTIDLPVFLSDLLQEEMRRRSGVCGCSSHDGGPYVLPGGPSTPHINSVTTNNWFRAAARSRYYSRTEKTYVPVPVTAGPFVGEPTRGRRAANASWVPILPGATPHSLRHSHRVWMDDDGIPEVLKHERLGHELQGIRGVYSHVSPDSRQRLCEGLTARWEQSLRQRAALHPFSPVPLLDDLIRSFREEKREVCSQHAPKDVVSQLRARPAGHERPRNARRTDTA